MEGFGQISSAAGDPHTQISLISGKGRRVTISAVGRVVWSVREGRRGDFEAPEILGGYRSPSAVREPRLGELLRLPDGSGPWRVVDWAVADRIDSPGNVLIVQPATGEAA